MPFECIEIQTTDKCNDCYFHQHTFKLLAQERPTANLVTRSIEPPLPRYNNFVPQTSTIPSLKGTIETAPTPPELARRADLDNSNSENIPSNLGT